MAYRPDVPNEANLVRSASGDLALMQENFSVLAPVASGLAISGTAPSAAIRGFYFGDPTNHKRFFIQSDGSDIFQVQRNLSGESSPVWETVLSITQVSGADLSLAMKVSGIDPTAAAHLATKNYVDTNPTLSGLADTAVSGPTSGQVLEWDGSDWANVNHLHALNDLSDVSISSPASGEVLQYNGAQWQSDALTLGGLSDVAVSGVASGQVLSYDGSDWVPSEGAAGTLSGLTDTSVSGATSGQVLEWDGVNWVSQDFSAGTLSGMTDTAVSGATSGQVMEFDGVYWRNRDFSAGTLSGLTDTAVSGATSGQVLTSNGAGGWTAEDIATTLSGLTDTAVSGALSGQVLTYDGSNWTPVSGATGGGGGFVSGIIGRKLDTTHSPVGLWNFEQDLTDDAGSGYDLTVKTGAAIYTIVNGLIGAVVDANNNFHHNVSGTALQITGDLTVEAIVQWHDFSTTRRIVHYSAAGEGEETNGLYSFSAGPDGWPDYLAEYGAGTNINHTLTSGMRFLRDTLSHVTMTRTDSGQITFYLNGVQMDVTSSGLEPPTGGGQSILLVGDPLSGVLCSLKIIASGLTSGEVWAEYERTWAQTVDL